MRKPRGIRNNNPGNIRKTDIDWQGEVDGPDPDFEMYASPQAGIRAMTRILLAYQRKHGLKTIREIISRWAPPVENDSEAYVLHVAEHCGVDPDEEVSLADEPSLLRMMVECIILHENGQMPYAYNIIAQGVDAGLA